MSSFSNIAVVRHVWRPAGMVGGWISGTLSVACLAAAVVLGGATAAVQLAGAGVVDAVAAWTMVAQLFTVGAALAVVAYACFGVSEQAADERFAPE